VNGSDPSGLFDPCNLAPLQPICQGVGSEIRNAVGGVVGYWDHLTAQAGDYVRRTLVSALFGANGLLVKVAQSDFAAGVNDGVVDFARGLAGVPGAVKDHLDTLNYYDQHPRDKPPLLQGLVFRALKENLSQNPDVQLIQGEVQLLKGLWDVVQGLRKALACGAVARGLGHALATLVLNAAVAELGGRFVGALSDTLRGDEIVAATAEGDTHTVRSLSPYSDIKDTRPKTRGAGKIFTPRQKATIYAENQRRNGGKILSDDPAGEAEVARASNTAPCEELKIPPPDASGVIPDPCDAQIDHIIPSSRGGTNDYSNARVISRRLNRYKSDNI